MWREPNNTEKLTGLMKNLKVLDISMSKESSDALEDLRYRQEQARIGGGIKKLEAIRSSGRSTARDRISNLLDEDLSLIHI